MPTSDKLTKIVDYIEPIVCEIIEDFYSEDDSFFTMENIDATIYQETDINLSSESLKSCLDRLVSNSVLAEFMDEYAPTRYSIRYKNENLRYIQTHLGNDDNNKFSNHKKFGPEWVKEALVEIEKRWKKEGTTQKPEGTSKEEYDMWEADGGPPSLEEVAIGGSAGNVTVVLPASDRYVSVRDNQEPFDQLEKSLDEIKGEFARDHNRGQYAIEDVEAHILNIDIIKAQIKRGLVNLDELRNQLRPSLQKLEADCKSLAIVGGTIYGAIAVALTAIKTILGG